MKILFLSFTIACFCSALNYSVKDADHNAPTLQARYRGKWVGKTDQEQPIQFTIDEQNRLTELEVKVIARFSYNQSCAYTYKIKDPVPIQGGQFDVGLISSTPLGYTDNTSPRIRGSLTSTVAANGSVNQFRLGFAPCGDSLVMGQGPQVGPINWSADRQVICPTITGITPTSGPVGIKIMIKGKNLADVTTVKFTNDARANFTIDDDTQISLTMPAGAKGGEIAITQDGCPLIWSPVFTLLESPVPAVASLSPVSTTAGRADLTITLTGSNFIPGSIIRWNGADRATQYVSETQLIAQIAVAGIANIGKATVTVFNPAPSGGSSNALEFTINPPPNPSPTLSSLSPETAMAGARSSTLTMTGANFINASVVQWNGKNLATTFVSDSQLTAQIAAADLAKAGVARVKVFSPEPGGGSSEELSFKINPKPRLSPTQGNKRKPKPRPSAAR